jgi:drug/metabolite transporter (DMT)-like permease
MALFFVANDAPQATAPDPLRGNVLAALSGVAWGGTVLGLRWVGRAPAPPSLDVTADTAAGEAPAAAGDLALTTVVAGNVLACVVCLPLALPVESTSAASWLVVLYLGVVQIGVAYLALASAMPHVPALEASTLLLVEPGLNPVWAYLAHGERPAPLAWAGGALIVLSALAKTWWDARRPAAPAAPPAPAAAPGRMQG